MLSDRSRPGASKPDDLGALAFMPFVKGAVIFGNDFLKRVRRNNEVDFDCVSRLNDDVIVADFDVRWHSTEVTRSHLSTPPRSKKAEQAGRSPQKPINFNCIKKLCATSRWSFRRAEVICPTLEQAA